MNAGELIKELEKYPETTPVCAYDGLDPSDPSLITVVELTDDNRAFGVWEPYLFIS